MRLCRISSRTLNTTVSLFPAIRLFKLMLQHLFPPLSLTSSLSPLSILYLADAQLVLLFVSISLLLWTWASRLPDEVRLGWRTGVREPRARIARDQLWVPGPRLVRFWFCILSSR